MKQRNKKRKCYFSFSTSKCYIFKQCYLPILCNCFWNLLAISDWKLFLNQFFSQSMKTLCYLMLLYFIGSCQFKNCFTSMCILYSSTLLDCIILACWSGAFLVYVCVYVSVCEQVHSVSCLVSGSVALGGYVTASSVPDWHLPGVLFVCWSITSASYSVLFAGSQSKWNRSA